MFETHLDDAGRPVAPQFFPSPPDQARIPLHDLDEFSLGGGAAPQGAAPDAREPFALVALADDPEWRLAVGLPLPRKLV